MKTIRNTALAPSTHRAYVTSVAIDGRKVAIGQSSEDAQTFGSRVVNVLDVQTGQRLAEFKSDDQTGKDAFGSSVDLCGDILVVGAARDSSHRPDLGAVYVFDVNHGNRLAKFIGRRPDDAFGQVVAIRGEHLIVAARARDVSEEIPTIFRVPGR